MSNFLTYRFVSNDYELELRNKELALAQEKATKQQEVNKALVGFTEDLGNTIVSASSAVDKFKLKLKGVQLSDKPCEPTKEFVELWNQK